MSTNTPKRNSRRLRCFLKANEAVSALEYAILVGVISLALIGVFGTFMDDVTLAIESIGDNIQSSMGTVGASPF